MNTNNDVADKVESVKVFTQKVLDAISYCNRCGVVVNADSFFEGITELHNPFMNEVSNIYRNNALSDAETLDEILRMIFMSPAAQLKFPSMAIHIDGELVCPPVTVSIGKVLYFPTTDSSLVYTDAFRILYFLAVTDAMMYWSQHLDFVKVVIVKHLERAYRSEGEIKRNSGILLEAFVKMTG